MRLEPGVLAVPIRVLRRRCMIGICVSLIAAAPHLATTGGRQVWMCAQLLALVERLRRQPEVAYLGMTPAEVPTKYNTHMQATTACSS